MEKKLTESSVAKDRIDRIMFLNEREKFLKNYKVRQEEKQNSDTVLRIELQRKINVYIGEGKEKQEIIDELSKEEKYSKYLAYIPNWVEDKFKKKDTIRSPFNRSFGE